MKKITLNKYINRKVKVQHATKEDYNYLSINGHFLIKFKSYNIFTPATERKIKDTKQENLNLITVYDKIVVKNDLMADDTEYLKQSPGGLLARIYKVDGKNLYLDNEYIKILLQDVKNFSMLVNNSNVSPVYFKHNNLDYEIIIMPLSPKSMGEDSRYRLI